MTAVDSLLDADLRGRLIDLLRSWQISPRYSRGDVINVGPPLEILEVEVRPDGKPADESPAEGVENYDLVEGPGAKSQWFCPVVVNRCATTAFAIVDMPSKQDGEVLRIGHDELAEKITKSVMGLAALPGVRFSLLVGRACRSWTLKATVEIAGRHLDFYIVVSDPADSQLTLQVIGAYYPEQQVETLRQLARQSLAEALAWYREGQWSGGISDDGIQQSPVSAAAEQRGRFSAVVASLSNRPLCDEDED